MPLQYGFSTLGCAELSLDDALALAATHRLKCIELRALGGSIDLPAYFAEKFGTPAGLATHLRTSAVKVAAFDTSFKLIGAAPADREALLQFVPWAEAAGVSRLRVFDGGKLADDTELSQAVETMSWWGDLRRKNGWKADLMVETHDSLFTAAALGRFIAAAPAAGILWDSHHTWKKGNEDPIVTWRATKAHIVHIHVKDSVSRPSARHPFTYVLPGDGEFPAAPLFAALKADNFTGTVSFEWEKLWHPYLPSLDEALTVAARRNWW